MEAQWADWDLESLLDEGEAQKGNLTFYKLVFEALERLAHQNAPTPEVYHASFLALSSGFLATLQPQFLPQAVAAKNLLLKRAAF